MDIKELVCEEGSEGRKRDLPNVKTQCNKCRKLISYGKRSSHWQKWYSILHSHFTDLLVLLSHFFSAQKFL